MVDDDEAGHGDRSTRLKVLIVSPFFPYPPSTGFVVRTFNLARALAKRHDVTVLAYMQPHERAHLAEARTVLNLESVERAHKQGLFKRVAQVRALVSPRPFEANVVRSPQMQSAIDRVCDANSFDVIQVESCTMGQFRFPDGVPVVVDEHNIESELRVRLAKGERSVLRRLYNWLEFRRFRTFERSVWNRADGCVLTSEREVPQVTGASPGTPTVVVPNGVDLERFAPSDALVDDDLVVLNSTFGYRPNADAAEFLVAEVWPRVLASRPASRLQLVGRIPDDVARRLSGQGIEVVGEVEQVQPYLARAAVVAAPIRMGGGTRLKVVEALAMGKAMVSTSIGCEGIAVRDGEHLVIGDSADGFARALVELLNDPPRRERLGRAGRTLIEDSYSWDAASARLDELYGALRP